MVFHILMYGNNKIKITNNNFVVIKGIFCVSNKKPVKIFELNYNICSRGSWYKLHIKMQPFQFYFLIASN